MPILLIHLNSNRLNRRIALMVGNPIPPACLVVVGSKIAECFDIGAKFNTFHSDQAVKKVYMQWMEHIRGHYDRTVMASHGSSSTVDRCVEIGCLTGMLRLVLDVVNYSARR